MVLCGLSCMFFCGRFCQVLFFLQVNFLLFIFFTFAASSVTWRKNNGAIQSDALHVVSSEGDTHSLLIKTMSPSSVGSYCVTAVNAAGTASCSATLDIQPGETEPWADITIQTEHR